MAIQHSSPEMCAAHERRFWETDAIFRFTPVETRLFFYLMHVHRKLCCQNGFWHTIPQLLAAAGCSSRQTLKKARARLVEAKLLDYVEGGHGYGNKTRYWINFEAIDLEAPIVNAPLAVGVMVAPPNVALSHDRGAVINPTNTNSLTQPENNTYPLFDFEKSTQKTADKTPSRENENRPPRPLWTDVQRELCQIVETDIRRELLPDDYEIIRTVIEKFIACMNLKDWRDDTRNDRCMIAYWRDRLRMYYNSCKYDVRTQLGRLKLTEQRSAHYHEDRVRALAERAERKEQQQRQIVNPQQQTNSNDGTDTTQPRRAASAWSGSTNRARTNKNEQLSHEERIAVFRRKAAEAAAEAAAAGT